MTIKTVWLSDDGTVYVQHPDPKSARPLPAITADGVNHYILASVNPVRPLDLVVQLQRSAASKLSEAEQRACGIGSGIHETFAAKQAAKAEFVAPPRHLAHLVQVPLDSLKAIHAHLEAMGRPAGSVQAAQVYDAAKRLLGELIRGGEEQQLEQAR